MTEPQPVGPAARRPSAPPEGAAACPCGRLAEHSQQRRPMPYAGCCGRYIDHFDTTPAPDAQSLMRSRYTAFVREQAPYLLATWEAAHRPARVAFDPGVRWLGLEVRAHRCLDGERAEVEFVARQRTLGGRAHRLHELSRFVRQDGRWFYVDGDLR